MWTTCHVPVTVPGTISGGPSQTRSARRPSASARCRASAAARLAPAARPQPAAPSRSGRATQAPTVRLTSPLVTTRRRAVAERVAEPDADRDREIPPAEPRRGRAARRRRRAGRGAAEDERRPPEVDLTGRVHPREVEAEAEAASSARPTPAATRWSPPGARSEASATPTSAHAIPAVPDGWSPVAIPKTTGRSRRRPRSARRRHRPDLHPAVVGEQPERPAERGQRSRTARPSPPGPPADGDGERDRRQPPICAQNSTRRDPSVRPTSGPTKSATPQARLAPSASSRAVNRPGASRRPRRAGSRGRARPPPPCARRARRGATATQWRSSASWPAVRPSCALLDQAQPEVDVAEQAALVGRRERRPAAELDRTPDVVDKRRREQQVGPEPRMELRRLAAERRDADRVLEQAAGVGVVVVGGRRETRRGRSRRAPRAPSPSGPGCEISATRNSRKPASSSASRRIVGVSDAGSTSVASSERTSSCSRSRNFSTRPSTRTASPSAKRPSSSSTSFHTRASIGRSGRRARARGTTRRTSSAACVSSAPRRRPRRPGPRRARRSSWREPTAGPDAEPSVVAALGDLVEHRRRLLAPPAERRRQVGCGQLARPARARGGELAPRRLGVRAAASGASTCARAGRARSRPTGPSCSTRCEVVSTSRRCSEATALSTSFFARPVVSRSSGPVSGLE